MSSEPVLIQTRKDKHQQLNGGAYPLAAAENHYPLDGMVRLMTAMQGLGALPTSLSLEDFAHQEPYLVHGRITLLRKSGAITFFKLTDASGSLQLIASKAALSNYPQLSLLDLGDLVEITGFPCLSKTGEKSLLITQWKLLTKAVRPPPEKFAGIADQELKYRKRYLDLMSSEESRARFMMRSLIVRGIRKIMDDDGFMEVETSTLNAVSSGANAKPFTTHHNALGTDLYLRIAPELYLKRLLVGGLEKVYEIGRAYRNEGIDTRHNPEFTIMESYQAYADFPQLVMFTKYLLDTLDQYLSNQAKGTVMDKYYQQWRAERPFTLSEYREVPMYQAVMNACTKAELSISVGGCELFCHGCIGDDVCGVQTNNAHNPRILRISFETLYTELSKASGPGEKWAILFEHLAEPFLTEDYRTEDGNKSVPVFITEYPKSVSPLARSQDQHPNVADRFELFIEGRELANAFQELNDPVEQAIRFQQQLEHASRDPMQHDEDYIQALEHGLPPCVGLGLGVDRAVMLFTNAASIKDVILFPTLRPADSS